MVTIGGGKVAVKDAGTGEQDARRIERRETTRVIRGIGELYCLKGQSYLPLRLRDAEVF